MWDGNKFTFIVGGINIFFYWELQVYVCTIWVFSGFCSHSSNLSFNGAYFNFFYNGGLNFLYKGKVKFVLYWRGLTNILCDIFLFTSFSILHENYTVFATKCSRVKAFKCSILRLSLQYYTQYTGPQHSVRAWLSTRHAAISIIQARLIWL